MLRFPCIVLDHDDTVVQSEATVNYPCFCRFLEHYRPGMSISLEEYVGDCSRMPFVDMCKHRFDMTDAELEEEYRFWKAYARQHIPEAYPGIGELLQKYRAAGGKICVSSMSAEDTILRDYRTHFGMEPDLIFGWDLPQQYRKPSPYALLQAKAQYALSSDQILVIDDMQFAVTMARSAGCQIAFAGWGRREYPEICREMEQLCDHSFYTPAQLERFLFGE